MAYENKGIRDEMVTKYGLDNSKIGWDGKNVTYDGKHFMTPSSVSDGRSYAPQTDIQKAVSKYFSNGDYGVRTELENRGVDTSKLGFDNGIITYGGKNLMKPDRVENGVSYVSNPNDLTSAAIEAHKANGKNIVRFADYTAGQNLPFNISYNNGMVSVNGQSIKTEFVDNGVAYVDSAELDKAIKTAQNSMGIQDGNEMYKKYMEDVTPLLEQYRNEIENRKPFEYDYESDPVYQAYRDMYTREGDRAMRDVMGEYAANTGGYINSAGITAGALANNYYMQQLNDKIPQLYDSAYARYNQDYRDKLQGLESIIGQQSDLFEKAYGVNYDTINNIYANNALNLERMNNDYNRYIDEYNMRIDEERYADEKGYKELEIKNAADADTYQRILAGGKMQGYFNDWQNEWLAQYLGAEPGTKFNPFGLEENMAAKEYELALKYPALKGYSSSGNSGGKITDDSNINTGIKNAVGYINKIFKEESDRDNINYGYVSEIVGASDVLTYEDGTAYWNTSIPEGSRHAFIPHIIKELWENEAVNGDEFDKILKDLDIEIYDDDKYDYILK